MPGPTRSSFLLMFHSCRTGQAAAWCQTLGTVKRCSGDCDAFFLTASWECNAVPLAASWDCNAPPLGLHLQKPGISMHPADLSDSQLVLLPSATAWDWCIAVFQCCVLMAVSGKGLYTPATSPLPLAFQ